MTKRTGPLHDPNEDRKLELMMSVFDALKARKARRSEGLFALFSAAGTLLAASDHREEMLKDPSSLRQKLDQTAFRHFLAVMPLTTKLSQPPR